jgi:hypothetical protein
MAQHYKERLGTTRHDMAQHDTARFGQTRHNSARHGTTLNTAHGTNTVTARHGP